MALRGLGARRHRLASVLCVLGLGTAGHADVGRLTFIAPARDGAGGVHGLRGPVGMTVSPDGTHLYVASAGDNALTVFRRDPATDALSFVAAYFDGVNGVEGLGGPAGPRPVSVSPDGRHLYAAAATDAAVAVFRRDPRTGSLTFVEVHVDGVAGVDGLAGAWSTTVSPDGQHVYATGFVDQAVVHFRRDATTGALTFVEANVNGTNGIVGLEDP